MLNFDRSPSTLEFYKTLIENVNDGIYVFDEGGEIEFVNQRVLDILGVSRDDLVGQHLSLFESLEIITEREIEEILEGCKQVLQEGEDEVRIEVSPEISADIQHLELRLTPLRTDHDSDFVIAYSRDITEHRQRAERLQHQQTLLDAVIETSIDGILVIDRDRDYVTWNQQFIDMWGVPEELIGDNPEEMGLDWACSQLKNPEKFMKKVEYLYDHPTKKSRDQLELNDSRVFDRYSAPVEGADDTLYGRVWFFRDITERVEYEEKLENQNDRLEEFASVASHDLRNPLSVAQGRLELARDESDNPHLDAIDQAHDRMEAIITDILTIARDGNEGVEVDSVSLQTVGETSWGHVDTQNASLSIVTDKIILADERRLIQILENLFRNAVDHGGKDVTVTVGDLEEGFYVEDDGPGIPVDEREEVFEAGFSTDAEGTGFGLNIVQEISKAHGWEVEVTEGQSGGARIEFNGVEFTK